MSLFKKTKTENNNGLIKSDYLAKSCTEDDYVFFGV